MNTVNTYKTFKAVLNVKGARGFCQQQMRTTTTINKDNSLFNKLFPSPTLINPVLQPIFSVEPMEGGLKNKMGTLFKDKVDSVVQPQSQSQQSQQQTNLNTFDEGSVEFNNYEDVETYQHQQKRSRHHQQDEFNSINNINTNPKSSLLSFNTREQQEQQKLQQLQQQQEQLLKQKQEQAKSQPTLPKYHNFIDKHISNPNLLIFLVQSTKSIPTQDVEQAIKKTLDFEIGQMVSENIYDFALGGPTTSTFVSVLPSHDININPEEYYKRFSLFGFTISGVRFKILNASHLKTILIKNLEKNMTEEELRGIFSEYFDIKCEDENFLKMSFPQPSYNPHSLQQNLHNGVCHLTFTDHKSAVKALRFASCLNLDDRMLSVGWSRYIFSEGTAAANLISSLERKKSKQLHEIELMKDMIDLKQRVRELESKLVQQSNSSNNNKKSLNKKI